MGNAKISELGAEYTTEAGNYNNISSATTTVVKSSTGILKRIVINTSVAGAITVYDNTSAAGTKIATIAASAGVGSYDYGVRFNTGLTVVTAGASDLTVVYE